MPQSRQADMHTESVDIYSDDTNNAVMRHPGRRFPGVLIQGDSLYSMCQAADKICSSARDVLLPETYAELNALRNALWIRLAHYKSILLEHGLPLPFSEIP